MPTDLHYQIEGNARGRTLVLLYGLGSDHRMWRDCAAPLGECYRLVIYDRRGAGRSPRATGPQTPERETAVLDAAVVAKAIPVGCAMGTMVAAAFAARHPGRVCRPRCFPPAASGSPLAGWGT